MNAHELLIGYQYRTPTVPDPCIVRATLAVALANCEKHRFARLLE
jgi:hypothetical protein